MIHPLRYCLAISVALLQAPQLLANDPQINSLSPSGIQRGTEATLTISGTGLATAKEFLFYTPGITVKSLEAAKDDTLKAVIAVAPDCQLGTHAIRIRSLGGVSNLRTINVGNLAEVAETEPNTAFDLAQPIPLNVTVTGVVQTEDIDHFAVELKKGDRLNVELEGLRLGSNTFFDPTLSIRTADGLEVAKSDDAALVSQDCLCSLIAPQDGKYIIQLRDVAFGGNGNCGYRLHVGTFPRPTAAFPPGGRPGEQLTVRWIGDPAGDFSQEITLPSDGKSDAAFVARDLHGEAPSPNVLRVSDLPAANEVEPNEEVKSATSSAAAPVAMNGVIEKPG